jgi:predicted component of type VI protein secretion system
MRSLKINFGGANNVSIAWNEEISGLPAVAQHTGVAVMTQIGSDKLLPNRGTNVAASLFSYGVFDLLGIQHLLNFGALKARGDIQRYENPAAAPEERITSVRVTLLDLRDRVASIAIRATNQAGQSSKEVLKIS